MFPYKISHHVFTYIKPWIYFHKNHHADQNIFWMYNMYKCMWVITNVSVLFSLQYSRIVENLQFH